MEVNFNVNITVTTVNYHGIQLLSKMTPSF